jgi:phosphohistidine phosphatase SixA
MIVQQHRTGGKTVYVVRHGDYEYTATKPGQKLTPKGIEELAETGERIRAELLSNGVNGKPVVIYHSPQARAEESAKVLAERLAPIRTRLQRTFVLDVGKCLIGMVAYDLEQRVGIIVTHEPDIEDYTGKYVRTGGLVIVKETKGYDRT